MIPHTLPYQTKTCQLLISCFFLSFINFFLINTTTMYWFEATSLPFSRTSLSLSRTSGKTLTTSLTLSRTSGKTLTTSQTLSRTSGKALTTSLTPSRTSGKATLTSFKISFTPIYTHYWQNIRLREANSV